MVSEINGKIINKNGRKIFSTEMPKVTRTSDNRTNCDTTMIAQIMISAEKNCGTSSLRKYLKMSRRNLPRRNDFKAKQTLV